MFEWFIAPYSALTELGRFILRIPGSCGAPIDVLRYLTLLLCGTAVARITGNVIADRRLRRASPIYDRSEYSDLYELYHEAGARLGIRRLPTLHQHRDESPLAFTTGSFRPAVFLAPTLVRSLPTDELRAILVHELVHVRRRDNLRAWIESLLPIGLLIMGLQVATLYVLLFHLSMPLGFLEAGSIAIAVLVSLWTFRSFIWPRVVFHRELSCDDRVVQVVANPLVVAAALVNVWRLQRSLPPRRESRWLHAYPLLRGNLGVEARVQRLIDYRPSPRSAWRIAMRRAVGAAAVLWTVLFLWTFYRSDSSDAASARIVLLDRGHP